MLYKLQAMGDLAWSAHRRPTVWSEDRPMDIRLQLGASNRKSFEVRERLMACNNPFLDTLHLNNHLVGVAETRKNRALSKRFTTRPAERLVKCRRPAHKHRRI